MTETRKEVKFPGLSDRSEPTEYNKINLYFQSKDLIHVKRGNTIEVINLNTSYTNWLFMYFEFIPFE